MFKVLLTSNIPINFFNTDQDLLFELLDTHYCRIGEEITLITRQLKIGEYDGSQHFVGENED